jgi:hypothetical protein
MNKNVLVRHLYSLLLTFGLCSFVIFNVDEDKDLEKNELSYSDRKIDLKFAGLEEIIPLDASKFRTDIYLSDVDLNDAGVHALEQILMVLKNYMNSSQFKNGKLSVRKGDETGVEVQLYTLNGVPTELEVISGNVEYSGTYPQIEFEFEFLLSNGESLEGSYSKEIESFKYYF